MGILEASQQRAIKILKALEYLVCDKRLRKLGLFSLENRKLRMILSTYIYT